MSGLENDFEQWRVEVEEVRIGLLTVRIVPLFIGVDEVPNWVSGEVHTHMSYAGTYRNTPAHLVDQADAENLAIVENLIVNKEQRIPDIAYFSPQLDQIGRAHV